MATRLLTGLDGQIAGAIAVNTRTAEFLRVRAKAVTLCLGAAGRLGLPQSGYLRGTYENAANSGDGYSMAFYAGAALANLECYQINPLIKDYNGPACAYVAGPFCAYTTNADGNRFIECEYWSGQMMQEFHDELQSGKGPVFLKLDHLHDETIGKIESILHNVERPSRGRFHAGRGTDYRRRMVEMHVSEIGFCSGHSASGVLVDEFARTTVRGLYAAGDMASVPHNYMLGAFTNGAIAGEDAADFALEIDLPAYEPGDFERKRERLRVLLGFASATLVGVPFGLLLAINPTFRAIGFPVFELLRPIPPLAWVPASIIFWPIQELSIAFVIFIGVFYTIVINVLGGAEAIDVRLIQAAQSIGASRGNIFRRLILPGVAPSIRVGTEVAIGITWEVVVAAEMISSGSGGAGGGLGFFIWNSYIGGSYPDIVVGMVSIGMAGYASSTLVRVAAGRLTPWQRA